MAYLPTDKAAPGTHFEIDVRGKPAHRRGPREAPLPQGELTRGRGQLPRRTSSTTPSTTGRASTATPPRSGITWYAQDQLGEVVFFDPPEVGSDDQQGPPYAEVESVKAVSDVIAPLSGEIIEVNEALERRAGADQRGPLRRGLAGQDPAL